MKKVFLLPFALVIMGVLFLGCEKDSAQEEFEMNQQSTERSGHLVYDGWYCITEQNGCHCRLVNYAPRDYEVEITLCPVGVITPPSPTGPYSGLTWGDLQTEPCQIPPNSCYPYTLDGLDEYKYTFLNENNPCTNCPHPTYDDPHSFCSPKNNLFKLCNNAPDAVNFSLVCELDGGEIFFSIPSGECKIIRVNDCAVSLCDENDEE